MPNETKKTPPAAGELFDSALATAADIHPPASDDSVVRSEPRVIAIRGAREHNLADVSIDLPRDRLVVLTGLSGSGKSSLAFDRSMPRASAAMSNRFRPMRASFWK